MNVFTSGTFTLGPEKKSEFMDVWRITVDGEVCYTDDPAIVEQEKGAKIKL